MDTGFFSKLAQRYRIVVVLASLPDEKDGGRIRDYFQRFRNTRFVEIALSGTRGYLHYDRAKAEGTVFAEIHYEDTAGFRDIVDQLGGDSADTAVYCLGTQTYIRLVKMAYASTPDQKV